MSQTTDIELVVSQGSRDGNLRIHLEKTYADGYGTGHRLAGGKMLGQNRKVLRKYSFVNDARALGDIKHLRGLLDEAEAIIHQREAAKKGDEDE